MLYWNNSIGLVSALGIFSPVSHTHRQSHRAQEGLYDYHSVTWLLTEPLLCLSWLDKYSELQDSNILWLFILKEGGYIFYVIVRQGFWSPRYVRNASSALRSSFPLARRTPPFCQASVAPILISGAVGTGEGSFRTDYQSLRGCSPNLGPRGGQHHFSNFYIGLCPSEDWVLAYPKRSARVHVWV